MQNVFSKNFARNLPGLADHEIMLMVSSDRDGGAPL